MKKNYMQPAAHVVQQVFLKTNILEGSDGGPKVGVGSGSVNGGDGLSNRKTTHPIWGRDANNPWE